MAYSYTIDENNAVTIKQENSIGSIIQPNWPNGTKWANADEAKAWADAYIESLAGYPALLAPVGPGEKRLNQPNSEQGLLIQNAQKAIFDAKSNEEKNNAQKALQDIMKAVNPA